MGKSVQHDEIYLWLKFGFNPLSHVGVIAPFQRFLPFLCYFFQKCSPDTTGPIGTELGMNVPLGILYRTDVGFSICQKTWQLLLKIEHRGQTFVFHIYLLNRYV